MTPVKLPFQTVFLSCDTMKRSARRSRCRRHPEHQQMGSMLDALRSFSASLTDGGAKGELSSGRLLCLLCSHHCYPTLHCPECFVRLLLLFMALYFISQMLLPQAAHVWSCFESHRFISAVSTFIFLHRQLLLRSQTPHLPESYLDFPKANLGAIITCSSHTLNYPHGSIQYLCNPVLLATP